MNEVINQAVGGGEKQIKEKETTEFGFASELVKLKGWDEKGILLLIED